MRHLVFALALLGATGAQAQTAIPDLKGTWSGKGKSIVFGSHAASMPPLLGTRQPPSSGMRARPLSPA